MDDYESLNSRLDTLDRFVTAECRAILNLDKEIRSQDNNPESKKSAMGSKMQKLDVLAKLHLAQSKA